MTSTTQRDLGSGLRRVLGLPAAVMFGLAYMLPLTVFTTFGIVNQLTEGNITASYVVTLVAMLFTAFSYAQMVRAFPVAGSAYTYTKNSMGRHVGFLSGWTLLLDYLLMPLLTYLVIGIYLAEAFPVLPQSLWIVLSAATVTVLNILGIRLVSRVAIVLLVFQAVFLIVFAVMALSATTGNPLPSIFDVLGSQGPGLGVIFTGAAILCLSFLGFDAVSALAEETVDSRTTIPKAIIIVTLVGGVLFILVSLVANYVFPDYTAYSDPDSAALDITRAAGGDFLAAFFTAAYVAGCFAAVLASQSTVARILFAMGRDGQLPRRVFGYLHPRFRTPVYASLIVGVIGLGALFMDLDLVASLISFGALAAFTMVNLAVIKHYYINQHRRAGADVLRHLLAPMIGVALCVWLWTSLSNTTLLVGALWLAAGLIYLAALTRGFRRQPPVMEMDES